MQKHIEGHITHTFNCTCGSIEFKRPEIDKNLKSFYEGNFVCESCNKEHDYMSKCFERSLTQLELCLE